MAKDKRVGIGILVVAAVALWLAFGRKPAEAAELARIEAQLQTATGEEEASLLARKAELEAIMARRIVKDPIRDAAQALYGVAPLDPLTEEDLALAAEARRMILAGDYNMKADGTYISSIPRAGESTTEFAARAKREKEAYRVYQMSQSEYYRAKWGLEPIAAEVAALEAEIADQLGIPVEEAATMTSEELLAAGKSATQRLIEQAAYIERGAVVATVEATRAAADEAAAEYAAVEASPTASTSEKEAARRTSSSKTTTAQIVQRAASAGITVYTTSPTGAR